MSKETKQPKKKKKAFCICDIHSFLFKNYFNTMVTKIELYCHEDRYRWVAQNREMKLSNVQLLDFNFFF